MTSTKKLFMYKKIIWDDRSYRGPAHFAKTRLWPMLEIAKIGRRCTVAFYIILELCSTICRVNK